MGELAKIYYHVKPEADIKELDYNTPLPTPTWQGVDTLRVGSMWRAASGASIVLGDFVAWVI